MADDQFMWIDAGSKPDIEGETTDGEMSANKAFELISLDFGAHNPQSIGSGTHGAGAGKGEYTHVAISKNVDKASFALAQHALAGTHLKEANILIRRAGGTDKKQVNWIEIKMLKVFVSSININSGGGMISESVMFNCGAVEWKYYPQKKDGTAGTPVPTVWSAITNKPELKVE